MLVAELGKFRDQFQKFVLESFVTYLSLDPLSFWNSQVWVAADVPHVGNRVFEIGADLSQLLFWSLLWCWHHLHAEIVEAVCEGVKHLEFTRQRLDLFSVTLLTQCLCLTLLFFQCLVLLKQLLILVPQFFQPDLNFIYLLLCLTVIAQQRIELSAFRIVCCLQLGMLSHHGLVFFACANVLKVTFRLLLWHFSCRFTQQAWVKGHHTLRGRQHWLLKELSLVFQVTQPLIKLMFTLCIFLLPFG